MSIADALSFTLHWEGGFVDNVNDHGGATNEGITQSTYDSYRKSLSLPPKDVEQITDYEVSDIYNEMYWKPAHCDDLPLKLSVVHFDWCVNHGVNGAIKTLQAAAGVAADGVYGPLTAAACTQGDEDSIISAYNTLRRVRYHSIAEADPSQMQFLKGWLHRVDDLETYIATL